MVKKYHANRKELAEAKIGMTHEIYIKELKDCNRHTVRVVHVGMLAQVVYLLNDNDTVMYTVKVKSHNQYSIQSIGQTLVNEIVCNSGEHGIHVKMGRICIPVDDIRGEVKMGDILHGIHSGTAYEVIFVKEHVIVLKNLSSGNMFAHDDYNKAMHNYKGLSYE
ncbi:MAG: hypothetical protein ACRC9Y_07350 [Aeromonas veronii]